MRQSHSGSHNLLLKFWWAKDEMYRQGVVKSFDCVYNSYKMHKVLFDDDGVEVFFDLKRKRWMLFEDVSTKMEEKSCQYSPLDLLLNPDPTALPPVIYVCFVQMRKAGRIKVSPPESGIICVQGYKVKSINAPILKAIFKKHKTVTLQQNVYSQML
ncbi:phospholipase-like protein [Artemisia annua]|uniref:Phospholipase-like protein n=1 Tax=Artemisia annua TaxID=35608 RepID=A0A2U1N2N5_ARTAN|nr:phospholipase-like protein [Artemisia annua]